MSSAPGDLFLLVYGIDSRDSFDEVKRLVEELVQLKGPKNKKYLPKKDVPPLIIVGNKCDIHSERQVSLHDLKEAAQVSWFIVARKRALLLSQQYLLIAKLWTIA